MSISKSGGVSAGRFCEVNGKKGRNGKNHKFEHRHCETRVGDMNPTTGRKVKVLAWYVNKKQTIPLTF